MEKSGKIKNFETYESKVLRKSEITRVLNTVKNASFNAQDINNSSEKYSFKKKSLLEIALNASSQEEKISVDASGKNKNDDNVIENTIEEKNDIVSDNDHQVIEESEPNNNFNEENKKQLIEQNNALIEQRIKDAELVAFEKGKQEGLTEGHNNGISEARSQSQQGLDAAISIFRIAAETIDNSDQTNLDVLNDTIQKTIIEIAQQSAGFIIDKFPQKFLKRINEFSKIINENFKKISLDINSEDYGAIKDFIQNDEFLSSINFKITEDLSRGDMRLNADGIKIDDLMIYGISDLLIEPDKFDTETSLDEKSDASIPQPEDNPNTETSLEKKSTDEKQDE